MWCFVEVTPTNGHVQLDCNCSWAYKCRSQPHELRLNGLPQSIFGVDATDPLQTHYGVVKAGWAHKTDAAQGPTSQQVHAQVTELKCEVAAV